MTLVPGPDPGQSIRGFTVIVVVVGSVGVWQPALLAPPGSVAGSVCPGTGCCQKAYGGHSGHASLGSLSERLGMGRAGSRMASPLRNTHTHKNLTGQMMLYIECGEDKTF